MTYVDQLVDAYRRTVTLPWPDSLAPAQRVWMLVYKKEQERQVRLNLPQFEHTTKDAGYRWKELDITDAFERWMAAHEYREAYFESPDLLETALPDFFDTLVAEVRAGLEADSVDDRTVVGLVGAGALYGLGDRVKLSALVNEVAEKVRGRLLVFFPGQHEGNSYRLLDARDGYNYLATPITANGGKA